MKVAASKTEAFKLMMQGMVALADVEATGMPVDTEYLTKTRKRMQKQIEQIEEELKEDPLYWKWQKLFGTKTNLDSNEQLVCVLSNHVLDKNHIKNMKRTAKGQLQMDETALEAIDFPFVKKLLKAKKLKKADGTFLHGIESNLSCDDQLRTFWNLHIPFTFRGSSDSPNLMNFPIRNPKMAKIIRSCFRAPPGHVIVEIDFVGIEVRVAACYNKDPRLISYIKDPSKDMHRDMASEIYMIPEEHVSKETRHTAKNLFVFPQFYGDYYVNCARNMWNDITRRNLEANGVPMIEHLKSKGIKQLGDVKDARNAGKGTFIKHMRDIEDGFWNSRFRVYNEWKKEWWQQYLDTGRLQMLTGFVIEGILNRKEVINYPIQGSAFHCLLWSLVQIHREILRSKMAARIIAHIHDSIIAVVRSDSVDDYVALAKHIMTERILNHYKWINVPLDIEAEVTPIGGTWFEKKAIEL